ncbi:MULTISPECIES: mannitol-1-phosphate 5-dehydrogenase [Alicyclobacillus]|uniref:Mannitol-1-phosphate 5-dehydrogenase n=1 Tax=Alicyclobacillus vulcanalis TaxID=252246 RepID=A0A1N7PNY1_9BACL|nr:MULTISPECIES: mannitol-1-phosphate 5-dehydrogenase [Alicyclobacillus]SIT12316.1 D-mannitol 1-phosphate 5-dehydrogenase [Alicyclobacillus vulcanalis]
MKRALHFGAGNIGRGFIGWLLKQAGFEVTFADVVPDLVSEIAEKRSYRVIELGEHKRVVPVDGVDACLLGTERCVELAASSDWITTAVGVRHLGGVAEVLAEGFRRRMQARLDGDVIVIACENAVRATSELRRQVYARADESLAAFLNERVRFLDAAVDRIAPHREGHAEEVLDCVVESYYEWVVEGSPVPGAPDGITWVADLGPYLERKLYLVNGAHAAAAYLAHLRGIATIGEALADPFIRAHVERFQCEAAGGLAHRHAGFALADLAAYAEKVRVRFANPYVIDHVARVGRDPLRKLAPGERLVGPLMAAAAAGLDTSAIQEAVASALLYSDASDAAAVELQRRLKAEGVEQVVREVCGLEGQLFEGVIDAYRALKNRLRESI